MVPVRLYGGGDPMQGRLEVFWKNKWGTVCDDYVTEAQVATVVCRQLGYGPGRAVLDFGEAFNHSGAEVVWWTLRCGGGEASVHDCQWNYDPNCDHSEDVGVVCSELPPPPAPPAPPPAPLTRVRLAGGPDASEGRLEAEVGGMWGTVCDDEWGPINAKV
ncbi:hypothetical protein CHLNCDRAFT_19264, partial [Chlorella variabilis]